MGDFGVVVAIATPILGLVIWAVRQEGRINAHDLLHGAHDRKHEEIREDLTYIRQRIDSALNGKH